MIWIFEWENESKRLVTLISSSSLATIAECRKILILVEVDDLAAFLYSHPFEGMVIGYIPSSCNCSSASQAQGRKSQFPLESRTGAFLDSWNVYPIRNHGYCFMWMKQILNRSLYQREGNDRLNLKAYNTPYI